MRVKCLIVALLTVIALFGGAFSSFAKLPSDAERWLMYKERLKG